MIVAAIETMGEAVAMAEGYGVQPGDLLDVLTNAVFTAPVYKNYGASSPHSATSRRVSS